MLFFVKGEMKETHGISNRDFLELGVKHWEVVIKHNKEKKILLGGQFAGKNAGFAIYNANSPEELNILLSQDPMTSCLELEILPLTSQEVELLQVTSPESALQLAKKALEALKQNNN